MNYSVGLRQHISVSAILTLRTSYLVEFPAISSNSLIDPARSGRLPRIASSSPRGFARSFRYQASNRDDCYRLSAALDANSTMGYIGLRHVGASARHPSGLASESNVTTTVLPQRFCHPTSSVAHAGAPILIMQGPQRRASCQLRDVAFSNSCEYQLFVCLAKIKFDRCRHVAELRNGL